VYDPERLLSHDMGPNPLWLLEDLSRDLDFQPGMRVLDLGSGKGAACRSPSLRQKRRGEIVNDVRAGHRGRVELPFGGRHRRQKRLHAVVGES